MSPKRYKDFITVNCKIYHLNRLQREQFKALCNDKEKALLKKYANL